jgi:photosystem II stability/assembly factor-like uncharacterized protein
MRIKIIVLTLLLASLACTANVSVLNPTATSFPEVVPTTVVQTLPPVSAPPLEGLPSIAPANISSIQMLDPQNGWMITNTFVLRTMDGGTTWHDVSPKGASMLGFGTGTSFLDSNRGWVLTADPNDPVDSGTLYHTADGGLHWDSNSVPFGGGEIHFLDDAEGWMMLPADVGAGNMAVKFFQTTDGGKNWIQVFSNLPNDANSNTTLPHGGIKSGFTPISQHEAWVSGQSYASNDFYLYHTANDGHTWEQAKDPIPDTGEAMYQIQPPFFLDPQAGILPMTVGSEGMTTLFLKTQDGGSTWTIGKGIPGAGRYSVANLNDVFVWSGDELSVSHDGGETWTTIAPNVNLSDTLSQFQFVDAHTGWAVTNDANGHASLYKTTDGGQTWTVQVK